MTFYVSRDDRTVNMAAQHDFTWKLKVMHPPSLKNDYPEKMVDCNYTAADGVDLYRSGMNFFATHFHIT